MKASIIIAISGEKVLVDNFLFFLCKYPTINDYEIIFVNDYPDYKVDEEMLLKNNIQNYYIINLPNKLGYGLSNNIAVKYATNEIIIFMNDDIILTPGCLELLVNDIMTLSVAAVQPKLLYPQSRKIQSTGHVFTNYTNSHAYENNDENNSIVNKLERRTALTTALCATTKSLFNKFSGFNKSYINAWEGMEYTLKLTMDNYVCMYEPKAIAYHIRSGTRAMYNLDERAQSALFWAKWSSIIVPDLHNFFIRQLDKSDKSRCYFVLNFSRLVDIKNILAASGLLSENIISYSYISGENKVDLFKTIPTKFCELNKNIIYFSNNFTQLIQNKIWFELRKDNCPDCNDMILDLCGNIIKP